MRGRLNVEVRVSTRVASEAPRRRQTHGDEENCLRRVDWTLHQIPDLFRRRGSFRLSSLLFWMNGSWARKDSTVSLTSASG